MVAQCQFCGLTSKYASKLKEHMQQKHQHCSDCIETFPDRLSLIEHLIGIHQEKLKCDFCNYVSLRSRDIQNHANKIHLNLHHDNSSKEFARNSSHFQDILCQFCPEKCSSMSDLRWHYAEIHYFCHDCRVQNVQKSEMCKHLTQVHHFELTCGLG